MIRTLHGRLALALVVWLGATSITFAIISVAATRRHMAAVNQELHADVASHLVEEQILLQEGRINEAGLEHIFHMMMVVNPGIEIYLLTPSGRILAYSAPPGKVKASRIDLTPIRRFLDGPGRLPLEGDDPRAPGQRRPFSAAVIGSREEPEGYLYVVLGGERYTAVLERVAMSRILEQGFGAGFGVLILGALAGVLTFGLMTRRLRRLRRAMLSFESSGFTAPPPLKPWPRGGDELDDVRATFERLAGAMSARLGEARSADDLRRELVANVSHDLRTPLATLNAYLETLLLKDGSFGSDERKRYLGAAHRHGLFLGDLVGRLFELAELEAKQITPEPEPFSPGELLQDVAQKFEPAAQAREVLMELDIAASTPFVAGDLSLVERVLDNLIDNALRHTPAGGRVILAARPGPSGAELSVRDTGCGIPQSSLPFIFDRHYRESTGTPQERPGGLGLAIANHIVELHGSQLLVSSEPGTGSSFFFELPSA
ncbi:MAG: ATP-binding protein [Myxococcota bacterium]